MSEELNTVQHNVISKNSALAYAAFGAFVAAILDTASNEPSSCNKFGEALAKVFSISNMGVSDTVGVLFVIVVAAVLARADQFKTEKAAIMSGLMIFSTIALLTPLKSDRQYSAAGDAIINNPLKKQSIIVPSTQDNHSTFLQSSDFFHLIRAKEFNSNARVLAQSVNVSSCKPSYYGFLGLGSFINNNLKVCPSGHVLQNGVRVEILGTWKTWAREYWYAKIKYQIDGKVYVGWIQAGWKENPWGYLQPDKLNVDFQSI